MDGGKNLTLCVITDLWGDVITTTCHLVSGDTCHLEMAL